ncbi:MAG: hypothetical protein K2X27_28695 [Candidatus Obscuribacterales bacterium]|nr:hypothetical protein [Candidatus Obscuribacterales bacterium]
MEIDYSKDKEKAGVCNCERCQKGFEKGKLELASFDLRKEADKDPLAGQISEFENKNALEIVRNANQLEYKISVNGQDKILTKSDASPKGLAEAEKKIAELVDEKIKELEKSFNVAFSKAGDDVVKQWVEKADCSWERGPMVKARSPQLIELYGIQACLTRCQPSDMASTGQGVKFHFLEDNYYKDQPVLAYFVGADKDGRPSVYFEPGANNKKPATEKDAERFKRDQLFSIEALTTHELSHNHQAKMGWHTAAEKETLAKAIGWMPFVDKDGSTEYMMQGKKGEFYRYGKDTCKDSKVWVKCDKSGTPLDDKDLPTTFKNAKQYRRQEIADRALVKPLTYYFPNPVEMYAEGLMLYRLGDKRREELLRDSPALYKAAKAGDQAEIDQRYGKDPAGQSKKIRTVDGELQENNAENRKSIQDFEDKINKSTKTSSIERLPQRLNLAPQAHPELRLFAKELEQKIYSTGK